MNTKILLVDDEPDILYILKTALSRKGYQVHAASDGQAALELYRSEAFDLVISDLRILQMDGLEVIRRMKLINADAEFIILTGFGTSEEALRKSEAELRRLSMQLLSAREEERKRVALDVHDAVGQNLCAIKINNHAQRTWY